MKYLADAARRYVAIRPKGSKAWMICEPHEAQGFIDSDTADDPAIEYETEVRFMKPSEFNAMKEFDGW